MAKSILVVDHNPLNRSYLTTLLGYCGYALSEAADGAEAHAFVAAKHPDLIIADILMPSIDGYEFVRQLRAAAGIARTPVILCSAHFHAREAKDLARECGVSHVLAKPYNPEAVLQAVADCLGNGRALPVAPVDQNFDRERLRLATDKLSQQATELTKTSSRLESLVDISAQLASETNQGVLLDKFCAAARHLVTSRYALLGIPSADGTGFTHLSASGIEMGSFRRNALLNNPTLLKATKERRRLLLLNPGGDPTSLGFPASFRGFESLLVAPVLSPGNAYGWLALFHRLGAPVFDEEDERLAAVLTGLVGRVYENGQGYALARQQAAELKREVTERVRAQEESTRLAGILHSSDDAIIGMRLDGAILTWNRGATQIFGYSAEEIQEKPHTLLVGADRVRELETAMEALRRGEQIQRYETTGVKNGGGAIEIAVTLSPVFSPSGELRGTSAIIRDITAHKQLEQQFLVAQKMQSVGRLAAGIAHDFNNLLTVITGYSSLLLGQLKQQDPEYDQIHEVNKAAEKAAALTRQLLAFSRPQMLQPRVVDLNAIVADMDRMLRRVIGEDIDLTTVLEPQLGTIKAGPGQLEQVIMNLAVNARDAMSKGGHLTIETANVQLDDSLRVRSLVVPPGSYVMLAITDTGVGMDMETQQKAFEPFFTTKGSADGTGLGLSTVYGIVEHAGGGVLLYSEPGHGTTFKVYLPRLEESAAPTGQPPAACVNRGSETVLVVEDEEAVRGLITNILRKQGYNVLQASGGREALVVSEQHKSEISLIISDIVMPGMTGVELARRLGLIRQNVKLLFMSGYSDNAAYHQQLLTAEHAFLEKPLVAQSLIQSVRELLDRPQTRSEAG